MDNSSISIEGLQLGCDLIVISLGFTHFKHIDDTYIWSEYYCTAWYMNSIFKNGFMAENCHYSFTIGPFLEFKPPLFVTILFAPLFCQEIVGNKSIVNLYCNKTRGSTINVPSFLGENFSEGAFSYFSS